MSPPDSDRPSGLPRSIGLAAVLLLVTVGGWWLTSGHALFAPQTAEPGDIAQLQHRAFAAAEIRPGYAPARTVALEVEPGETLQSAVERAGVDSAEASEAVDRLGAAMDTVHIKAGLTLDAAVAEPTQRRGPARLIGLSLRSSPATALTLSRTFDGALKLRALEEKVTEETTVAGGRMAGSLYESAAQAGASPAITAQVVKLFSHKLDFSRDIRPGDRFKLVFDRKVTDTGRTIEAGDLRFAEIEAKGGETRFYRFDRPGALEPEFFDGLGRNIRGFLLRTPVDGAQITSVFGQRRHPILGYTRAHQGVDFGAGTGTPILAAGDGVVLEARTWGGYGNWLRIRHSGQWDTGYGHISRYARGIRPGVHVRQGQVVAYVGATGLATGPHLHFEVWNHGARVNPQGAKVPQGSVLAGRQLAEFRIQKAQIDRLLARHLGDGDAVRLASAEPRRFADGLRPSFAAGGR